MNKKKYIIKYSIIASIIVICVLLDQLTKFIAETNLEKYESVEVIKNFFYYNYYGSNLLGPLNKNIVSFNDPVANNNIVTLSTPRANPPCGGQPYLKNSR